MRKVQLFGVNLFEKGDILTKMYQLLHENMQTILKEQIEFDSKGYNLWAHYNKIAIDQCRRKTVVVLDGEIMCGFFQYSFVDRKICSWDELQIDSAYRGDGRTILLLLQEFFKDDEYKDIITVRVKVNSNNHVCLNLIKRRGFILLKDVPRGAWYEINRISLEKKFEKYIKVI